MKSYIVRIIRKDKKDSELIVGTVEDVETEKRDGFNNFTKLKDLLTRSNKNVALKSEKVTMNKSRSVMKKEPHYDKPDFS